MKYEKTIGFRLRYIREHFSYQLKTLSSEFNKTSSTLSRYESNNRKPDIDFISNFGEKFQLSSDWLLYGYGSPFRESDKRKKSEKDMTELWIEFIERLKLMEFEPNETPLRNISLPEISADNPRNFFCLLYYMLLDEELRCNIFHIFHINEKRKADKRRLQNQV